MQLVVSLTADHGVVSLILDGYCHIEIGYYHREIGHEIISMVIHLLPLIQEGLLSVTSESMSMNY